MYSIKLIKCSIVIVFLKAKLKRFKYYEIVINENLKLC